MNLLTGFTDSPRQSTNLALDDGSFAVLELFYRPQQMGWFYNLTYKTFEILGQRVVYSENLLRQFQGQIPFGLAVLSKNRNDPLKQSNFASAQSVFVLLNAEDVETVEQTKYTRHE